jgi:hypothetical protein
MTTDELADLIDRRDRLKAEIAGIENAIQKTKTEPGFYSASGNRVVRVTRGDKLNVLCHEYEVLRPLEHLRANA